jgi:hypothetical protein
MANDNLRVEVENLREIRRELNKVAPDIKKSLDKANRELVKPLIQAAQRNFETTPMSNWGLWNSGGRDLSYNVATVRKGIKVKQRGKSKRSPYSSVMALRNESAAGAIYETAGRQTDSQFTDNLQRWFAVKKQGLTRGIWKAVVKDVGTKQIVQKVVQNYEAALKDAQRRIDRA